MTPVAKRTVGILVTKLGFSERRACRIVGLARSVQQYRAMQKNDAAVIKRMKALASENRRYGYLRLHAMLRREGLVVNHKRTIGSTPPKACRYAQRSVASYPDGIGRHQLFPGAPCSDGHWNS